MFFWFLVHCFCIGFAVVLCSCGDTGFVESVPTSEQESVANLDENKSQGIDLGLEVEQEIDAGVILRSGRFQAYENEAPLETTTEKFADQEGMKAAVASYVREDGEWIYIGNVVLNPKDRTISFPVSIAEKERQVEYVLVHSSGKVHESVFQTDAAIQDIHTAALLLDVVGENPQIEISWKRNGGESKAALAQVVGVAEQDEDFLSQGHWNYNGSLFEHGNFSALREGSIIALMNDPYALVNHPKAGGLYRDDVFFARKELLPTPGVQMLVTFHFP